MMLSKRCAHCDERKATHFTETGAAYDECCEECYGERYTHCLTCDSEVPIDALRSYMTHPGSYFTEPEYDEGCTACVSAEDERGSQFDTLEEREDFYAGLEGGDW